MPPDVFGISLHYQYLCFRHEGNTYIFDRQKKKTRQAMHAKWLGKVEKIKFNRRQREFVLYEDNKPSLRISMGNKHPSKLSIKKIPKIDAEVIWSHGNLNSYIRPVRGHKTVFDFEELSKTNPDNIKFHHEDSSNKWAYIPIHSRLRVDFQDSGTIRLVAPGDQLNLYMQISKKGANNAVEIIIYLDPV